MSDLKLSTLAVVLGLIVALRRVWTTQAERIRPGARKFSRNTPVGYALMLLGTCGSLLSAQESVSDFAT